MKKNRRSHLVLGLLVVLLAPYAVSETSDEVQVDPAVTGDIVRPAINDPFPQVDPITGQPVADDFEVSLPGGKKMRAKDYYAELNAYQSYLNKRGHTLKGGGAPDVGVVVRILNNVEELGAQKDEAKAKVKDHDPEVMDLIKDPDQLYDSLVESGKDSIKAKLKELYLKILKSGDDMPTIAAPEPRARVVLEAQEQLNNLTFKEWTLEQGDKSKFAVDAKATLQVQASLKRLKGLAEARANVAVLSHPLPLVNAHVKGNAALDENAKADVLLEFAGKEIYKKEWSGKGINIVGKDEATPPAMTVKAFHKFRFALGPVPMSGEIGAAGQIGYDWAIGATDKSGAVAGLGYADVSGYAQVGADIEIASVGVGGELIVLRDELKIEGKMGLEVDAAGSPRIETTVKGTNKMTTLAGNLYAYVRATVPTLGVPPYEEKQWDWELFKWEGLDTGGEKTLFSFGKVVDQKGYSLFGAPTEADYQDVQVDAELQKAFAAAMASIQQEGNEVKTSGEKALGGAEAIRLDLVAWLEGIDD